VNISARYRSEIRERLWAIADNIGWISMNPSEKSKYYEIWTRDPSIGGVLSRFMDKGQVRVYLKDTLLKDYSRVRLADPTRALRVLGLEEGIQVVEEYQKPHGRRLADGRVLCWGRADDWKAVLMAIHERAFIALGRPFAAVLLFSDARFSSEPSRLVVESAAKKLGIERVIWLD
jgi:hypothetical protein